MIALIRTNFTSLILKPNSNKVCKSHVYLSLYFKTFSTSCESQPGINHELSNMLVHKHNFDPEFVSRVASKLTHVKNPENAGLILSFFRENDFPDYQLEKVLKVKPRLLSVSLEHIIKPKINLFQEVGLSSDDISKMILRFPGILDLSLNDKIIPSLVLLKRLLGSNGKVARVIRMGPKILSKKLENSMLANVEFLESCGVPMERIRIVLTSNPCPFLLKPEIVRKSVEKAEEMGVDVTSKMFIYAVPTLASMSNEAWLLKLQELRSLGFSDSDIVIMFRKAPQVFAVSTEKMKKIVELLLDTRKYTMSSILDYPKSLQFSISKRYMPRLQILGILESRNLIESWPSLAVVCKLSDGDFLKKFSSPYSDKVSDVCSIENSARDGKR